MTLIGAERRGKDEQLFYIFSNHFSNYFFEKLPYLSSATIAYTYNCKL